MISTLLALLRLFPFLCGGHRQLALENLALGSQATAYGLTGASPSRLSTRTYQVWRALAQAACVEVVLECRGACAGIGERDVTVGAHEIARVALESHLVGLGSEQAGKSIPSCRPA
jgi:hypothetical protein